MAEQKIDLSFTLDMLKGIADLADRNYVRALNAFVENETRDTRNAYHDASQLAREMKELQRAIFDHGVRCARRDMAPSMRPLFPA